MSCKLPDIANSYKFNAIIKNWFNVECVAEILFKPKNIDELCYFLKNYQDKKNIKIIGATSNIIFKNSKISGVLLKLPPQFAKITHKKNLIKIGCAALCQNVASYCAKSGLGNLEFYSGIPGTIGGAIAMNAGCYGSQTSDYLIDVIAINEFGDIEKLTNKDFAFDYRYNKISANYKKIFIEAQYNIAEINPQLAISKIENLRKIRQESQPISAKTGGSTFKNPQQYKAWQLIDGADCRGLKFKGAEISSKHCNFIINNNANGNDIIELMSIVKQRVLDKFDIELQEEIVIIE